MSGRRHVGVFAREAGVLAATRAARAAGLTVEDVQAPYPVHGIEEAMGLRRSRIPFACLAGAVLGGLGALLFQHWASAVSWPVDVGGKPFSSIPAFIPITFEMTVLGGALGAILALVLRRGLRPGRRARLAHPRVTDDRFALVVRAEGGSPGREAIAELFAAQGAEEVFEVAPAGEAPARARPAATLNAALAAGVVALAALHLALHPEPARRGVDVMPEMAFSVPYDSLVANPVLPGGATLRSPPEGSIARGFFPERFRRTKEDAARAGERLANPFAADDAAALRRGEEVFRTFCIVCHGAAGTGDGPVAKRGFPPPASLLAKSAREMKDGRMYHVITVGQANMPGYGALVPRRDRWRAILYVRALQAAAKEEEKRAKEGKPK